MNERKEYFGKANNLIERLLDEQPEEEEAEELEELEPEETEEPEEADSKYGQVEVYFNGLDEQSQKVLIDSLKESLNISADDDYAHQKLVEALADKPLITFRAEELIRKLNIDI